MVGAGGAGLGGAVAAGMGVAGGATAAKSYESKRLEKLLIHSRSEILDLDQKNFFISATLVTGVRLEKKRSGCALVIKTIDNPTGRKFRWKPALNNFSNVLDVVSSTFGNVLER